MRRERDGNYATSLLSRFAHQQELHTSVQARRHVCVDTHALVTWTTWICLSPNGPHSKSQGLSFRSGHRRRLLSFRHVPLLLSAYRVFPRSRPNQRQREVLMTWQIIPSIPLYNTFDRRATRKVEYRTLDTQKDDKRNIVIRDTSLYRIIDINTDRTRV